MWTFLREANNSDGTPGPFSGRRIAAFVCLLASLVTGVYAVAIKSTEWPSYIPCVAFLVATLFLFFFTTWGDVADAIAKARGLSAK